MTELLNTIVAQKSQIEQALWSICRYRFGRW